jgi:iron complex outermembrane receptor protein
MTPRAVLSLPTYSYLKWAGRILMRAILISATLAVAAIGAPLTAQAIAKHYNLNIPRQPLDSALKDFAQQTGLQIARLVSNETSEDPVGPVSGDISAEDALKALLAPRGLTYQVVNERTIAVVEASKQRNGTSGARSSDTADSAVKLEEIVVTAQKREERLQVVPVPVTAISADTLVNSNQLRLQDYYAKVPGLNFTMGNRGEPFLSIRGITTDIYTNPTIGVVVDDVPYGSSTVLGGGFAVPDIDPSELRRVEVLRGPQGTLYGASSIGGLLKYVTVDPSTDRVSGSVQGGLGSIYNKNELGYSARGAINVPLSDTLAIRASGFTRRDPGYIDDPTRGAEGVNQGRANGGRLSALWHPSQDLSLKLSALIQDSWRDGSPEVHLLPGLGDLQQSALQGTGVYDKKVQAYSANLTASLGGIELTSLTGYSVNKAFTTIDYTPLLGSLLGVAGVELFENNETNRFSQEVRISAAAGPRLNWLFGVFYTHEDSSVASPTDALNSSGASTGTLLDSTYPTTYEEYAAFANLTLQLTDRFDVQVGGRESRNEQRYAQIDSGPLVPAFFGLPTPLVTPEIETKGNAFTYLVTPRFRVSPDLMVYARFASGYRPGGPNTGCARFAVPCQYDADKTQNYELGIKGDVVPDKLSFDASVYYVDWKDIQLLVNLQSGLGSFNTNAGRAKSQGLELSLESHPLTGLAISGWVAWNDAVLTENMPSTSSVVGKSGDRLPVSSRFTGSFSLQQEFALPNNISAFFGGSVSYVGRREGSFPSVLAVPARRQEFPAYATTDLRAGLSFEAWKIDLYANNVTDRRGVLSGGLGHLLPYGFTYIQPRTVGLSLARTF